MEERIKQLQVKIEADAILAEKLFSQETAEQVQVVLKEEGLDFSLEEINQLKELIAKALEKGGEGELSDEDLEKVAGGFDISDALAAQIPTSSVFIRSNTCVSGTGTSVVGKR